MLESAVRLMHRLTAHFSRLGKCTPDTICQGNYARRKSTKIVETELPMNFQRYVVIEMHVVLMLKETDMSQMSSHAVIAAGIAKPQTAGIMSHKMILILPLDSRSSVAVKAVLTSAAAINHDDRDPYVKAQPCGAVVALYTLKPRAGAAADKPFPMS